MRFALKFWPLDIIFNFFYFKIFVFDSKTGLTSSYIGAVNVRWDIDWETAFESVMKLEKDLIVELGRNFALEE